MGKPWDSPDSKKMGAENWPELEGIKSRLALHMDRVEYFASARNKVTEMRAHQAKEMEFSLRSRSNPTIRVREDLAKSTGSISTLMDNHSDLMRNSRTSWKRLDAIHKFANEKQAMQGP